MAINLRLSRSEQIQIGSIQDKNGWHGLVSLDDELLA